MAIKQLDPRMINPNEALTNTRDTYIRNLTSENIIATNVIISGGNYNLWTAAATIVQANSALWEETADITPISTIVTAGSANWNTAYDISTIVQANSALWEETADIIPTITNLISTSNIKIKDITFADTGTNIFNNTDIFGNVTVHGTISALSGINFFQTIVSTTSSLSVVNVGNGPALLVSQGASLESVAQFKGANGNDILTINNVDPDLGQPGVKIYFTGSGNTFVVGNSANNTALVVTSAGNINTSGQLLSAGIPLHNIFLTAETDSQTLSYTESNYNLSISNGNNINLSSVNTTLAQNSAKWEGVYNTVNTLSANWEESADITAISTLINTNSANWNSAYTATLSSNLWNNVFTNVQTNSGNWTSTYTNVQANSGNWQSAYTTFTNNSTNYILQGGNTAFANLSVGTNTNNHLFLETVSTIRVAILSTGNMGIGTISPNQSLTVVGNISSTGNIFTSAGPVIVSSSTLETPTTGISAINNIVALTQSSYNNLTVKLPNTFYIIV